MIHTDESSVNPCIGHPSATPAYGSKPGFSELSGAPDCPMGAAAGFSRIAVRLQRDRVAAPQEQPVASTRNCAGLSDTCLGSAHINARRTLGQVSDNP
jgi:hypothetical protein